jgi:uncharacterized protein (DUF2267 family)
MKLNAINAAITNAFDAIEAGQRAHVAFKAAIVTLRPLLAGETRETAKAVIAPMVAKCYGEVYADGKWADKDGAAKRNCNRILAEVFKGSPAVSTKTLVKLPKGTVAAIQAALAGLTKAQVTEALAQAKAGLSFE